MTDINEYSRNFTGFEMPGILKQLVEFDNSPPPGEAFSQGFEFGNYEDKQGVKTLRCVILNKQVCLLRRPGNSVKRCIHLSFL